MSKMLVTSLVSRTEVKTLSDIVLQFGLENSKLVDGQVTWDLPAGYTCPGAEQCLAKADRKTGKITNGKNQVFRCFKASLEAAFSNVREKVWSNFDSIKGKTVEEMVYLLSAQLPEAQLYRIHTGGDFFSQDYFDAWCAVAGMFPDRVFYAYTKSLPFWVARLDSIPSNLRLTASYGGRHDHLIKEYNLKSALVVNYEEEAQALSLEIDHDDRHAFGAEYVGQSFALLIHGTQTPGTAAADGWNLQKRQDRDAKFAYVSGFLASMASVGAISLTA